MQDRQAYDTDLTDAEWTRLEPLVPAPKPAGVLQSTLGARSSTGSEVAHKVALTLATVRRSNGVCSFPAPRFHEESRLREASEGINQRRLTSPYSP